MLGLVGLRTCTATVGDVTAIAAIYNEGTADHSDARDQAPLSRKNCQVVHRTAAGDGCRNRSDGTRCLCGVVPVQRPGLLQRRRRILGLSQADYRGRRRPLSLAALIEAAAE